MLTEALLNHRSDEYLRQKLNIIDEKVLYSVAKTLRERKLNTVEYKNVTATPQFSFTDEICQKEIKSSFEMTQQNLKQNIITIRHGLNGFRKRHLGPTKWKTNK